MYDTIRYQIGPQLLILICPLSTQILTYLGGPEREQFHYSIIGNVYSWIVVSLMILWAFLSLWIPGKTYNGPMTKDGYVPVYKANGLQFFLLSVCGFSILLYFDPNTAVKLTDNFHEILATCNVIAFILCIYLLLRGKSNTKLKEDENRNYPLVYEFYRGMEVHPRLFGVDVKQLTNCRFGLMVWQLLVITFFVARWQTDGFSLAHFVTTILQTIYLGKFYWWETGYFTTLDITLDRAGYYICWGCVVWVPAFYTYTSYYLVANAPLVDDFTAMMILGLGFVSIALNYRVDWEKEYFRNEIACGSKDCKLWGKKVTYIEATYESVSGTKKSTLLTSGLWGTARHLNYLFEIGLALAWSLPAFGLGILPFSYFIFITVLLIHRIFRDEEKCSNKYGKAWNEYCKKVPYRIIPFIF